MSPSAASSAAAPAAAATGTAFSAVPDAIGAQDISGPCEVVQGWPQDLQHASWPREVDLRRRAGSCREPESCLSARRRRAAQDRASADAAVSRIGPNVQFPLAGLPWRNANTASPPGAGGSGQDPAKGMDIWRGASPPTQLGVDSRWEHSIVVVNAEGKIIEVDAVGQVVQASARGLHQSLRRGEARVGGRRPHPRSTGSPTTASNSCRRSAHLTFRAPTAHFNRPTFMAWLPDGASTCRMEYNSTRVAKFDAAASFSSTSANPATPERDAPWV